MFTKYDEMFIPHYKTRKKCKKTHQFLERPLSGGFSGEFIWLFL